MLRHAELWLVLPALVLRRPELLRFDLLPAELRLPEPLLRSALVLLPAVVLPVVLLQFVLRRRLRPVRRSEAPLRRPVLLQELLQPLVLPADLRLPEPLLRAELRLPEPLLRRSELLRSELLPADLLRSALVLLPAELWLVLQQLLQ